MNSPELPNPFDLGIFPDWEPKYFTMFYVYFIMFYKCFTIQFGNCLPGTEFLQSTFRMEFRMGSLSRQYQQSLQHYCQSLRHYHRSLQRCRDPWDNRRMWSTMSIIARLTKHNKTSWNTCKTFLYIVKHCETHVKHEPLLKHHETLSIRCADISAWRSTSALLRSFRPYHRLQCWYNSTDV